jgi:DMSO reductase family type II enzyme chaperone
VNGKSTLPSSKTSALPEVVQVVSIRSSIYVVLAQGFSYPSKDIIQFFRQCSKDGANDGGELGARLNALIGSARSTTPEELQSSYIQLFDPLAGPFPYETEQKKLQDFFKAQLMADVMGFYRAFGVEPRNERPDHIASELEFMHYLALKEAHALRAGQPENASLCRDAQVKFFHEHLATWTDAFIAAIRSRAWPELVPFYIHLVDFLQLFIENEKEELR